MKNSNYIILLISICLFQTAFTTKPIHIDVINNSDSKIHLEGFQGSLFQDVESDAIKQFDFIIQHNQLRSIYKKYIPKPSPKQSLLTSAYNKYSPFEKKKDPLSSIDIHDPDFLKKTMDEKQKHYSNLDNIIGFTVGQLCIHIIENGKNLYKNISIQLNKQEIESENTINMSLEISKDLSYELTLDSNQRIISSGVSSEYSDKIISIVDNMEIEISNKKDCIIL